MPQYKLTQPPFHQKVVDNDGNISHEWRNYLTSVHTALSNNFNSQGTQIAPVASGEQGSNEDGVMYYDSSNSQFVGYSGGSSYKFTVTPTATSGLQIPVLSAPPSSPQEGEIWYNRTTQRLEAYATDEGDNELKVVRLRTLGI